MLGLQIPFRLFGALILGSALFPMAQTAKDAALLGGAFLVGLGAIEVVLRFEAFETRAELERNQILASAGRDFLLTASDKKTARETAVFKCR